MHPVAVENARSAPPRSGGWPPQLLAGALAAVVGALPWIISGMRLPLQNLWSVETAPDDMPLALLPFSQYYLTTIVAIVLTGSALAGAYARVTEARRGRGRLRTLAVGVVLVQGIALVQTSTVVGSGLQSSVTATVYLAALVAGTAASMLVGLLILTLIARGRPAGALLAVALVAVPFGSWLTGLVVPSGSAAFAGEWQWFLLAELNWVPAILVGLAIAWCGVGTVGRGAAVVAGLLALWILPALFTGVTMAAGTRVLAGYPSEMLEFGLQVFVAALGPDGESLRFLALAVIVGALGLAARQLAVRRGLIDGRTA